jgi:hypothetical protein
MQTLGNKMPGEHHLHLLDGFALIFRLRIGHRVVLPREDRITRQLI